MLICIQQIGLLQYTVLQEKELKYHHHELIIYGWKRQRAS